MLRSSTYATGQRVLAQRTATSPAVAAVVVAVDATTGCPAIARLRRDGSVRAERIWAGLWLAVVREATEADAGLPMGLLD